MPVCVPLSPQWGSKHCTGGNLQRKIQIQNTRKYIDQAWQPLNRNPWNKVGIVQIQDALLQGLYFIAFHCNFMPFRWCRAGCITICREENQPFWVGGGRQLTLDQMFPWTTTTLPPWWWSWLWWSCWWRSPWVAKTRLLGHQMPLLMSLWAACHSQTIIHTTITTITTITIGIYSVCHHHHLLPNFRLTSSSPLDTSFWVGRISHLGHQMDPVSMSHNVTQSHHTIHKGHEKWKTNQHSVQTYSDQCRTVQSSNRKEL